MPNQTRFTPQQWLAEQPAADRADCEQLLYQQLNLSRAEMLANATLQINPTELAQLNQQAARLAQGEPLAYILGSQGFWDMELQVSPAVLIPRPDTELLVELALEKLTTFARSATVEGAIDVCELGTGSGAIALALARSPITPRMPTQVALNVFASDICPAALNVAKANAERWSPHPANRLIFAQSDWFSAVATGRQFHLVVSNPPYVATDDPHLPGLTHEPQQALVAGPDGLAALRVLVAQAPQHLHSGGWLLLEHGYNQGSAVRQLLEHSGLQAVATHQDLGGNDRVTLGQKGA